jgi:hypothetical protein
VGGVRWTDQRGFLSATVRAGRGTRLQVWSIRDGAFSRMLGVR